MLTFNFDLTPQPVNYPPNLMPIRNDDSLLDRLTPQAIADHSVKPTMEELREAYAERLLDAARRREKPSKRISLSKIGECGRKLSYGLLGYEERNDTDPALLESWQYMALRGDAVHRAWQGALIESGVLTAEDVEQWLEVPAGFVGRNDGNLPGGVSLEIKSVAHKYFDIESPYLWDKLKVDQAQTYMHFLGVERTRYVVVDREGDWFRDVMEFDLARDVEAGEALIFKGLEIQAGVLAGELYQAEPGPRNKNCFQCGYQWHCEGKGM